MTKKGIKCIIVDDDPVSLKVLEALVEKTDLLQLEGVYSSSLEAAAALRRKQIELIFLDIEMPEMSGLDLIETLTYKPKIIITSGKEKYALDVFGYDVTDYLLKPVTDYSRFLKAVLKVRIDSSEVEDENIFIKVDSVLVNLDLKNILWVEAYGDYVKIHTEAKVYTVYSTLKAVEGKLGGNFMRVHRSYIVNLKSITSIDPNNLQIGNRIIPISNSYKEELMTKIKTL